jgi:type IV secretory pathway TrbF-like protein
MRRGSAVKHSSRWLVAGLIGFSLQLAACAQHQDTHQTLHPVVIEKIEGSEVNRVTMTERALERIALKTDKVREERVSRSTSPRMVVPHSSVIYDPKGQSWVYTSPQPRTFVRQKVDVEYVEGDRAVLREGPPAGTIVVSTAAAEVYGADFGVGH